jgi:hypothetical protein
MADLRADWATGELLVQGLLYAGDALDRAKSVLSSRWNSALVP